MTNRYMQKIFIKQIYENAEKFLSGSASAKAQKISVSGWIRTVRSSASVGFIELNDGTFLKSLQIVFQNNLDNFAALTKLSIGSAIEVKGELIKSPAAGHHPRHSAQIHEFLVKIRLFFALVSWSVSDGSHIKKLRLKFNSALAKRGSQGPNSALIFIAAAVKNHARDFEL